MEINKFLYFDDAHNAWITASELKDGQFWSDFHEIKTKRLIFLCCTFLDLRVLDLKFSLHLTKSPTIENYHGHLSSSGLVNLGLSTYEIFGPPPPPDHLAKYQ